MTDKEKADCILSLQKQKSDHFKQTRDIEFKVNISIWTLIVLIGYFGKIQLPLYICIALAIFVIHLIWMVLIQNSEDWDRYYMRIYRDEIEKMVGLQIKERELTGVEKFFKGIALKIGCSPIKWIFLEIMMTLVLLIGVGSLLFQNNNTVLFTQYSIKNDVLRIGDRGIKFEELLTIYGLYLVFVIFCFQEINDKMRHAQDRFRSWCLARKENETLNQLGINWEVESWLEKDLIFHLYDFKIKIQKAKEEIGKSGGLSEALKVLSEKACEDYFDYIYKCLKFKNEHKKNAVWLFSLLIVLNIARTFQDNILLDIFSYMAIILLIGVVYLMLRGPDFQTNFNNPFTDESSLQPEEKNKIKELDKLIKEI